LNFQNDAQKAVYERVLEFMTQLFGEEARLDASAPRFVLERGSAQVSVTVAAVDESPVVSVFAWAAIGETPSPELTRLLLTQNAYCVFGAYGLTEDDRVLYQHSIVGETIDKEQLRTSIRAVAAAVDSLDDRIASRAGTSPA
jgi:hypothetical protein